MSNELAIECLLRQQQAALEAYFASPAAGGDMLRANNLSDLISASAARTNLGLGGTSLTDISAHGLDYINVKDAAYGAVGDGVTDDSAAIQSAIDAATAAGINRVVFPDRATYLVKGVANYPWTSSTSGASLSQRYCLLLKTGVTLDLQGSTLKLGSGENCSIISNDGYDHLDTPASDIGVINGILDSDQANQTMAITGIMGAITLQNVLRLRLENLTFNNCRDYAVRLTRVTYGWFDKLHVTWSDGGGIHLGLWSPTDLWDARCYYLHFGSVIIENCQQNLYATLVGNPIASAIAHSTFDSIITNSCGGGLKFQEGCFDVAVGTIVCNGPEVADQTVNNATNDFGLKIQGGTFLNDPPSHITVGSVTCTKGYGGGLYIEFAKDVTVGIYNGYYNSTFGERGDVRVGNSERVHIGSLHSAYAGAWGLQLRDDATDTQIDQIDILNPGQVNAGAGVQMLGGTHRIGRTVIRDTRGVHTMTRGWDTTGSGGLGSLDFLDTTGATTEDIRNNSPGFIVHRKMVSGVDTPYGVTAAAGTANTQLATTQFVENRVSVSDKPADSLIFNGATTSSRAYWALGTAGNLATSPLSVPIVFVNDATTAAVVRGLWAFSSATTAYAASSFACYRSSDDLVVELVGATPGTDYRRLTYASFFTAYSSGPMSLVVTWDRLVAPIVYLNGSVLTMVETSAGTAPAWTAAIDSTYFVLGVRAATERWNTRVVPYGPINAVVSATEALNFAKTGRLATWTDLGTGAITEKVTNPDFETGTPPLATGWSFSASGASTAANVAAVGVGGSQACQLVIDGSNSTASVFQSSLLTVGKKYRVTFTAKVDSVAGSPVIASDSFTSWAGYALTTNFVTVTFDAVAVSATFGLKRSLATGRTITIDDVHCVELGPVFTPLVQPIAVVADTGNNKVAGVLTSGVTPITTKRDWVIQGTTSTNGNQQLLGASVFFDATRHMLDTIEVNGTSTATVGVGSASGGAQYVTAAAIASGRNRRTLVTPIVGTANIWVSSNATDALQHTIRGHLID